MAIGFGVIYSTTNFFHIAYGTVYMVAAFLLYALLPWHLPFAISIILAIILTIVAGILIEFLVYKPLHEKRASHGIYLISSLGIYILMINIIALIFDNETKLLLYEIGASIHLGGIILTKIQVVQFFTFLILAILSIFFMHYTRIGKTIQAMGCNARLLEFRGVNLQKMRFIVFAIGSFFDSIAAISTGLDVGLDPYMGMMPLLNAVTAVILVGVKRIEGTIAYWNVLEARGVVFLRALGKCGYIFYFNSIFSLPIRWCFEDEKEGRRAMNYAFHLLIMIEIYAILALSLNLVVGYTGLLSLSHAAFYGLGAYASALLMMHAGLNFFPSLAFAVFITAIFSLCIGCTSLKLRGDYFAISSFAFQVIIFGIFYNWDGLTKGPYGIVGIPRPGLFGFKIDTLKE